MSDQLTTVAGATLLEGLNLAPAKYADDKAFAAVASGSGFLPRLQLFGAGSELVKKGKFPMGHYGLVRSKDQVEDMTTSCVALAITWRAKALRIDGDDILNFFDPEHPEFKKIQVESEEKDSGCLFGPEFLLWLPESQPSTYTTFFCGSKTTRREAPNLKGLLGKACTLKMHLIETKKYSWHGPIITPCSTPFALPSFEEIKSVADKFSNPPESEVEVAVTSDEDRAR
jgi:hypothetical protein